MSQLTIGYMVVGFEGSQLMYSEKGSARFMTKKEADLRKNQLNRTQGMGRYKYHSAKVVIQK